MQTLPRAIRRGNAIIINNPVTRQIEVYWKRGLFWGTWLWATNQTVVRFQKDMKALRDDTITVWPETRWQRFMEWIRRVLKWQ